ncbi:MAG TPA: hypothetical protein VFE47_27045 [Tepidisphaeraceae bacterium]|nr:hypothetical protein [Tepidisphaeraceae bacterium]
MQKLLQSALVDALAPLTTYAIIGLLVPSAEYQSPGEHGRAYPCHNLPHG